MTTFETIFDTPLPWIATQLASVPAQPGRRAVVLVAAERQAHAIRRHICVDLAHPEHLAGVSFLRPPSLAREAVARAGYVRVPGWEDVRRLRILQLFESAALADQLRYFKAEQLRAGQGYVDAFARTIGDLEWSGVDTALALAMTKQIARDDPLGAHRLHDVALIWRAADVDAGVRCTTARLLNEAAELLGARPDILAPFGPIFALISAAPSTVLLRFLRALPGGRALFQEARPGRPDTQRWRDVIDLPPPPANVDPMVTTELQVVQRYLFELPETLTDPKRPRSNGSDATIDLEEYPSIEDEIEAASTWVAEQIIAGIAAEQIALIVPDIDPYAALLADRLKRAFRTADAEPVRVYVAGGLSLAASPAGMRLHTLLNAVGRGLEAEPTIRLLPVLRRRNQGNDDGSERLSPSRAAEIVYGAGILGGSPGDPAGVEEWVPRLLRRRDALRTLVEESDPEKKTSGDRPDADEPEKRLDLRARNDAQHWLRDVEPLLPALSALQDLATTVLGGASLDVTWPAVREFSERWLRLPPDPPNLLASIEESLQAVLADPVARAISGVAALRFLMEMLRRERRPLQRFGEPCIFIGTASHATGLAFTAVRVLGVAEGALPHTPHDDPIVPDGLRRHIEHATRTLRPDVVVPRLADRVLDEIHDIFRVIHGVTQRLACSAPRQWVDRSEREVSGIMLEVATALGRSTAPDTDEGDVPTAARLRATYLHPGRSARVRAAQEYPLSPRALVAGTYASISGNASPVTVPAGWTQGAALAIDRIWTLTSGDSTALGALDGVVTDAWSAVQAPGIVPERPISATALSMLLGCPYRFLLERVLYLNAPAARPSTDVIAPIIYGSLFHAAAERFFREAGAAICRREGSMDEWVARAQQIAGEEFDALRHTYPMRGEDGIARERDRLLRQIEQLVHYEWHTPAREFLQSEWTFGDPEPVRLELETGTLYVRGAIDRIDRISPSALSVRDLKTGRVRDFGEDPMNAARDLQIGLYVLALEAAGYGGASVGVAAYVHPSAAQEPDRAFDGLKVESLRRQTREWLALAHGLLRAGTFPRTGNPEDCTYCPFVPACGENAQAQSNTKLSRLPAGHALEPFGRFKQRRSDDEAST